MRTKSLSAILFVNMPELLAYGALALVGTKTDKGKVRIRKFTELTVVCNNEN